MLRTAAFLLAGVVWAASPANAVDSKPKPSPSTTGSTTSNSLVVEAAEEGIRNGQQGSADVSGVGGKSADPGFAAGSGACPGGAEAVIDQSNAPAGISFCQQYAEPTTPVLTVGLIRNAFAELKLPAGELVIQPPDGLTLVNFDTNFYTTSTRPIARTVTLLGRRVTLERPRAPSTGASVTASGSRPATPARRTRASG